MHRGQHLRLPVAALCVVSALAAAGIAAADPSPATPTPPPSGPGSAPRDANRVQWQACHKQADDQKLARGEARREFMKNCMKASQPGAAA
jgi:hypothetical protein